MLAGDVMAAVIDGDLTIYGDSGDNSIEVSVSPAGDVSVVGRDGTSVNGGSDPFVAFEGTGTIPDDLQVYLGRGDNTVRVLGLDVSDDIRIHTGSGDDLVSVIGTNAGDSVRIWTSRGDDTVKIGGPLAAERSTVRNVSVNTGSGDDLVGLANLDVARDASIRSGGGMDSVGLSNVGIDDDLSIRTSSGDDTIGITDSVVSDRTWIMSGFGDDTVAVRNSLHDGRVIISTSFGRDFVGVVDSELGGAARVYTSFGNDAFGAAGSTFRGAAYVSGGWGTDTLDVSDGNTFDVTPSVRRFEAEGIQDFRATVDGIFADLEQSDILAPRFATLAEIVATSASFQTLRAALEAAQLTEVLHSDGPFTVFAPTEDAFAALPPGTLEDLLADPFGLLTDILLYHVAAGETTAAEIVTLDSVQTVLGPAISVEVVGTGVVLNGTVNVIIPDVFASNGVAHVINAVLIPPPPEPG
jgi:uncharacterized surface protein with fasciclin (FAS1) repeats